MNTFVKPKTARAPTRSPPTRFVVGGTRARHPPRADRECRRRTGRREECRHSECSPDNHRASWIGHEPTLRRSFPPRARPAFLPLGRAFPHAPDLPPFARRPPSCLPSIPSPCALPTFPPTRPPPPKPWRCAPLRWPLAPLRFARGLAAPASATAPPLARRGAACAGGWPFLAPPSRLRRPRLGSGWNSLAGARSPPPRALPSA